MTRPQRRLHVPGPITDRLLPHFAEVRAYAPVKPPEQLRQDSGGGNTEIIKLDANENPYGPTPAVRRVIESFGDTAIYPDPDQVQLRTAIADYTGVGADRIVGAAGSDELIDLLLRLFVAPGGRVVTAVPTFGMYSFSTEVVGGEFIPVERVASDFSIDLPRMLDSLSGAKLAFLASPNNPTGNSVSRLELTEMLDTGVPLVVDEAYQEFSGQPSAASLLDDYPNLFVLRTFSKWAGLAGLRVGFGLFAEDLARVLMRVKPPYNVGTLAQAAAIAALDDREIALDRVQTIVQGRDALAKALTALPGAQVYSSDANFLLVRFPGRDTKFLHARMRRRGIALRWFDTPGLGDCIRLSVGRPEQNEVLVEKLTQELLEVEQRA
jgi:histidinol-phosphate aminotransferase